MQKVDIYLFTSTKAPSAKEGKFEYILTCAGRAVTGDGHTGKTSGHRLALECAIAAMRRMNRPAVITIHTDCQYLIGSRMYLSTWRDNGWIRSDGQELKNADLWKEWHQISHIHAVNYEYCPTINIKKDELKKRFSFRKC